MSLPLTRRIAKTVLLTAAGAASVVGTAGAASAAELPTTTDVGGLSHPDNTLSAATQGTPAHSPVNRTLQAAQVPDASVKAGTNNSQAAPQAARLVQGTAQGAQEGMQQHAPQVRKNLPNVETRGLPTDNTVRTTPARQTSAHKATGRTLPAHSQKSRNLLGGTPLGGVVSVAR